MADRTDSVERRQPALDGLRAIAVAMVLAYHGGVPGLSRAGFFGVDVFFVLSGYLITSLLLVERDQTGRIAFARFWARRARRLLPALLLMLVGVDIYVTWLAPAGSYPGFRDDALSVIGYLSNWRLVASSSNYFAATGTPSLLTHTWSLAIEEQFYLVWPLLIWFLVAAARRARRSPAATVAAVSGAGAVASAGWMAYLYRSGAGLSRLYYGTDTHAQGLLVGAALAGVLAARPAGLDRVARSATAVVGILALIWAACGLGYSDPLTYQGGFLAVAAGAAGVLLVVVRRPLGRPARVLAVPPLAYVGRISYGMYLWYFPLFAVVDHTHTGLSGPTLFAVRVAADVAIASASFHLVEQPIRFRLIAVRTRRSAIVSLCAGVAALAAVAGVVLVDTTPAYPAEAPHIVSSGSNALPGAPKLLVVGDSTGETLGIDLAWPAVEKEIGYTVDVRTTLGCGVVVSTETVQYGSDVRPPAPCRTGTPASGQWPALLSADLAAVHPQAVLVVAGRWEVETRRARPGGSWLNITQPGDAAYVRSQLDEAVSLAAAAHAVVGLTTAPCFSSGETASGGAWPEDSPVRLAAYNRIVRQVVSDHPGQVRLVDLDAMVCPGGRYDTTVDGVTARAPDGVHYPYFSPADPAAADPDSGPECIAFGEWIAPRILSALR